MKNTEYIPLGRIDELISRPDAYLLLLKPHKSVFGEFKVIKFKTRNALEEFNKKAGLRPVVYTIVPKNCVVWKHQKSE